MDIQSAIDSKRELFQKKVVSWAKQNLRDYPWREPGRSPYEILVAEILLKRTTAAAVGRIYETFLQRFDSVKSIYQSNEPDIVGFLSKLGLQRQRAQALKHLTSYLIDQQNGIIPDNLEGLLEVPGLGDYSARAILSFGFDVELAVLDTNVIRIINRVFYSTLSKRLSQKKYQQIADQLIPSKYHREYNWGLLDLGSLVCKYDKPYCATCRLKIICDYSELDLSTSKWVNNEIGLREIRKSKGYGLVELAAKTGLSKLTIINIEAGRTSPRHDTINKLAKALSVSCEEIIPPK